jgi:hypothetical protein|uniref:Uncharacterized protein n=1 Tax=viral metagenome TaxID=1070528 RepID=A0A6C0LIJ9_9ZZZZ
MYGIVVDKLGSLKEATIKSDDIDHLCKKCNFKNSKHFDERTVWHVKIKDVRYKIKLFAKDDGRANSENKYDFPPPVDTKLFFGSCILIRYIDNEVASLSLSEWEKIYEKLFGGFEDLAATIEEDENEEDELELIDDSLKSKDGYLLDGFIVDDSVESGEDDGSFDSELSEEPYVFSDED